MSTLRQRWPVLYLASVLVFSLASLTRAAEPPPPDDADSATTAPAREQTIYIPYEKLRQVFEREGRGVFLPYEEFQELWRAARAAAERPPAPEPPHAALISTISSEADVAQHVVRVSARLRIELFAAGWHEVPLRLHDAAITAASIAGQPARIVADDADGYHLLVEKQGQEPEELELALEYVKAYHKSPGQNSVSFEAPQAPVNRWQVRIPEAGVKVNISPLIAATQVPPAVAETPAEETVVLAFVGAAPTVQIDWTPRAEGAAGLKALVSVQAQQQVWIDQGVVRTRIRLVYDISRATVGQLVLEVPADQKVVNVFDANIRQWAVTPADAVQRITADLFEPAQGTQSVLVELEQFSDDALPRELVVPVVRAVDVGRQQGTLAVGVADGLQAEPVRRSGLLQMDVAEMPRLLSSDSAVGQWALAYRYVTMPFELALRVRKVLPRITADALVTAYLRPERLRLSMQAVYAIEKAGVFQLELEIPRGYEVRDPRGIAIAGAEPVVVESHHLAGDADTRLVVNLARQARGRVGLEVTLQKGLKEPDLLRPTGRLAEIAVGVPRPAGAGLDHVKGRLVVYSPESLRVSPAALEGLRTVSLAEALQGLEAGTGGQPADQGALAFTFAEEPARLTLKVERRKPYVTVRQFLSARVESAVVKYEATFFYDIRYSGVETLRIDLPAELADQIQNNTRGVQDVLIDPPPKDIAEGYVTRQLRGEGEFSGQTMIKLSWETKIAALETGRPAVIRVPHLRPMEVDRAWGQIALGKTETVDLSVGGTTESESPFGLRPIDPHHDLMPGAKPVESDGAAMAFEFHEQWGLWVTATRYELEEVKHTSIERAVVRVVVTRSEQVSTQALYCVRSARQRLAVTLPDGVAFDTDPVRINGRPVALERGQQGEFFVPLVGQNPDTPFVLEIRYAVPAGGGRGLVCPAFPSEPAAQKVYVCAYLPPERVLLGSTGPWTSEMSWRWRDLAGFQPRPNRHAGELIAWTTEGVDVTGKPAETFQTDGRMYLFSALRPAPPPSGALTLVTMDEDWLAVIVFAVLLVGGLVLLRTRAATRLVALGGLIAVLILAGVFLPTFCRQILDWVFGTALLVVLLVWLVWYLAWTRPRDPDVLARREARRKVQLARIYAELPRKAPAEPPQPPEAGSGDEKGAAASGQPEQGGPQNA